MIETMHGLPDGVLGFRAVGAVEAADYERVLDPAIDAAVDAGRKVNLVFVLGEDFERYSLGALWKDAELEGKPAHIWGRIALVTGHAVIAEIIHGISFLFPCELRIFDEDAVDDAVAWAAEGPSED
jgi:hypothetical protein